MPASQRERAKRVQEVEMFKPSNSEGIPSNTLDVFVSRSTGHFVGLRCLVE